ncbi:fungal-specific transcription factor domain-containing protein [Xylariomycetidae sp. FL2044]|nr:fungal-specific transcription factor domain-containing protein [Xylariomycetidae sp. FL2044]
MPGSPPPLRKACDLCYRRKIKCDAQKPRCSTCVLHKSDCTYKAASRKAPTRRQIAPPRQDHECDLKSRVEVLESQLSAVLGKVERLERDHAASSPAIGPSRGDGDVDISSPTLGLPELPPFREVLPIVEHYLSTFNSVLPLFNPGTLLQTVKSWYQIPHSRDRVTWALINVVLALAHHISGHGDGTLSGDTATYVHNAQSVMQELVMGETDLVRVQVLIGLVVLFWTADDSGPALILIGTALRLAHKIGLNTRRSAGQHCSPAVALQRNRVFWMAYILDRDISLQSRLAPVQLDADIDLDLPPKEAGDDLTGFIFAPDGRTKMNYFQARVDLANIQGRVFNCVYSASALNQGSQERARNAAYIVRLLDDWSSRVPPAFHPVALSESCVPGLSRHFCILYAARQSCRAIMSFASAADSFHFSEWMGRLQDYGGKMAAGVAASHAPIPQGWQELADTSREYMRLFETVTPMDAFFTRITLCAYTSSLISLIANIIFKANHGEFGSDQITKEAKGYLENTAGQTGSEALGNIRNILQQLISYADRMTTQGPMIEQTPSSTNLWDWDTLASYVQDPGSPQHEYDGLMLDSGSY